MGKARKSLRWACLKSAGVIEDASTNEEMYAVAIAEVDLERRMAGSEGIAEKHIAALMATAQHLIFVSRSH